MKKFLIILTALMLTMLFALSAQATDMAGVGPEFTGRTADALAKQIVKACTKPSMSQYEKAIAIYDWMIDHTVYKEGTRTTYDILRKGEATCSGYAYGYKALADRAGLNVKIIDGGIYTLGHTWNLIQLGGKWYHVDARMGDHFKESENRYRRFGMCNEQVEMYYTYRYAKPSCNTIAYNYAYRSGELNKSIDYFKQILTERIGDGETDFVLNMTGKDVPGPMSDPFNRITVKKALNKTQYAFPGIPGKATVTTTLSDNMLVVKVKVPNYRIKKFERTIAGNITIEVPAGMSPSDITPWELGDKVTISPTYATKQMLFWKSYNEKVAMTNQSGKVRFRGYGTAKILVTTTDGSKLTRSFKFTVKKGK